MKYKHKQRIWVIVLAFCLFLPITAYMADTVTQVTEDSWRASFYIPPELAEWDFDYGLTMTGCDLAYARFSKMEFDASLGGMVEVTTLVLSQDPNSSGQNYAIPNYAAGTGKGAPWSAETAVNQAYLQDGITRIGDYAFSGLTLLETVDIPESVTAIGDYAFSGATRLQASADGTTPLDLSHVSSLGMAAFSGCSRLGRTGGVTLGSGLRAIPDSAFSGTGLSSITLPEGIESIGNSAFSGCSFSYLELPDSITSIGNSAFPGGNLTYLKLPAHLESIGYRAFYCGQDSPNKGLTSLTIPAKVKSIGEEAFYSFQGLESVLVETEVLEEVGDLAFGSSEHDAYSKLVPVDEDNPDGEYTLVGTDFKFKSTDEGLIGLFESGRSCYLGSQSPLVWVAEESYPATCQHEGRDFYRYTFMGAQKELVETPKKLEHIWESEKDFDATCETRPFTRQYCSQNITESYPKFGIEAETEPHYEDTPNLEFDMSGRAHQYSLQSITHPAVQVGTETVITYACGNDYHSNERDGEESPLNISINLTSIPTGTTTTKVQDLPLPQVAHGKLVWDVPDGQLLEFGGSIGEETFSTSYPVKYIPDDMTKASYTGMEDATEDPGTHTKLAIPVTVTRTALDFSSIRVAPAEVPIDTTDPSPMHTQIQFSDPDAEVAKVYNNPEGLAGITITYYNGTTAESATPPTREQSWVGTVKLVFPYDPTMYAASGTLPENEGYTIAIDKTAKTVTITHPYVVRNLDMADMRYQAISPLIYKNNTAQNTIHFTGVPVYTTVTWTWFNKQNPSDTGSGTHTVTSSKETSFDAVPITNAGTYTVSLSVQNPDYNEGKETALTPADVTISPQPVEAPKAVPDPDATGDGAYTGTYTGLDQIALADPGAGSLYTYQEGSVLHATDAGNYTATAVLGDTRNYRWAAETTLDQDGNAVISWTIAKRSIKEASLDGQNFSVPFTGNLVDQAFRYPPVVSGLFETSIETDPVTGTQILVGILKATNARIFEISNIAAINANSYPVKATILEAHTKNFQWESHPSDSSYTLGTWTIRPLPITANAPTVTNTTYNGGPQTGNPSVILSDGLTGLVDESKTAYQYYHQRTSGEALDGPPTQVGTYWVETQYTFVDGKLASNYTLTNPRTQFNIAKAALTLQIEERHTVSYDGQAHGLPTLTVTEVQGSDSEDTYLPYIRYTYTPEGLEEPLTTEQAPTFTNVGDHPVTISLDSSCPNYLAASVTCIIDIQKAGQTITLNPGDGTVILDGSAGKEVHKTLGDPAFTVTGIGDSDKRSADSYTSSDSTIAQTDNNGMVTIKKAGTVTITVSISASTNVEASQTAYTLVIAKKQPALTFVEQRFDYNGGNPITGYENAAWAEGSLVSGVTPTVPISYAFYSIDSPFDEVESGTAAAIGTPSNVGEYYLRAFFPGDDNYLPAVAVSKVTVEPVDFTYSVVGYGQEVPAVYDGQPHDPVAVSVQDGVAYTIAYSETDDGTYELSSLPQVKDVVEKTYWYQITPTDGQHKAATGSITVHITPAELRITDPAGPLTRVYNGQDPAIAVENGSYSVETDVTPAEFTVTAAGEFDSPNAGEATKVTITYTLDFGSNVQGTPWTNYQYNGSPLSSNQVTSEVAASITKLPLTVQLENQQKIFDGKEQVTLQGDVTLVTALPSGEALNAALTQGASGTANANVTGSPHAVTVADPASAVTLTAGNGATNASNYEVTQMEPFTVTIMPKEVTLTFPGNLTMGYGSGEDPEELCAVAITGDVAGYTISPEDIIYEFFEDENCTGSAMQGTPTEVGRYGVRASLQDTSQYPNYTVAPVQSVFEITKGSTGLIVKPVAYSGVYDGEPHSIASMDVSDAGGSIANAHLFFARKMDGEASAPDAEDSRWQENLEIQTVSDSGDYWYKVETNNYAPYIGTSPLTPSISHRPLVITRTLQPQKTYNADAAAGTDQVTDFKADTGLDTETVTVTAASARYNSANVTEANELTITYTLETNGVDLANYSFGGQPLASGAAQVTELVTKEQSPTLGILPEALTITIVPKTKVYDGQPPSTSSLQDTDWKRKDGTVYGNDNLQVSLSVQDAAPDTGTYTIGGQAGNDNYSVHFETADFTITRRPVTIQIGSASGFYGETPAISDVTLTDTTAGLPDQGLVDDISALDLALSTGAQQGSPVKTDGSTYTISATANNTKNYDPTLLSGTYTVKPRPVTVTADNKESTYGCVVETLTSQTTLDVQEGLSGSALYGDDTLDITLNTQAAQGAPAADYAITVEVADNPNYAVTETSGTYMIHPAHMSIAFAQGNQIDRGVSISFQESYSGNPLGLANKECGGAISAADLANIMITYELMSQSPDGIASVDAATGTVSITGIGTVRVKATAAAQEGSNYTGTETTWYDLVIIEAGGNRIVLNYTANNHNYNGETQPLLKDVSVSPANAIVEYSLNGSDWDTQIPEQKDAGFYTVYWRANATGYAEEGPHQIPVTIGQIALTDAHGFVKSSDQIVYAQDGTYQNPLQLPDDYTGTVTYRSTDETAAAIERGNGNDYVLRIKGTGTVTISAECTNDTNYIGKTYLYTLTIGDASGVIQVANAAGYRGSYDGLAHKAVVSMDITAPEGYTVRYGVDTEGLAFTETEIPTLTDAGTYDVWYQITAAGCVPYVDKVTASIAPRDIQLAEVSGLSSQYTYSGNQIAPIPTVKDTLNGSEQILQQNVDYQVSYGQNTEIGRGSITITGMGNYGKSNVIEFEIVAVDENYLTASLDRYYGTIGDPDTNHVTVTVRHGSEVLDPGTDYTVTATPQDGVNMDPAAQNTLTFTQVGTYTIQVTVSGNHEGEFELTYTLMPQTVDGGLQLQAGSASTKVVSYGDALTPEDTTIVVKSGDGDALTEGTDGDYLLSCTYYDNLGSAPITSDYDPDALQNAGMYVVTAIGQNGYQNNIGTFVFLILKRNLADDAITFTVNETLTYNGQQQLPQKDNITGSYAPGGTELLSAQDYILLPLADATININAGMGYAVLSAAEGSNNFTGTVSVLFPIGKREISEANGFVVEEIPPQFITSGGIARPAVTVTDPELGALSETDFHVTYADNDHAGTALATISGTGNYTGSIEKAFQIILSSNQFTLTLENTHWIYSGSAEVGRISVQDENGELTFDQDYTLTISKDGGEPQTFSSLEEAAGFLVEPGVYTVTATGKGNHSSSLTDSDTVTIDKIKPVLTIIPDAESINGGDKITLTVTAQHLPTGLALTELTMVKTPNGSTESTTTVLPLTASETEPDVYTTHHITTNTSAKYVFQIDTQTLAEYDTAHYEHATAQATVFAARHTSGGGGGGGGGTIRYTITVTAGEHGTIDPSESARVVMGTDKAFTILPDEGYEIADVIVDGESVGAVSSYVFSNVQKNHSIQATFRAETKPFAPDVTGVSQWLNTEDHTAYLSGYPGGLFAPDTEMTRAEAAQMFYNLLLDKDITTTAQFSDVARDAWYAEAVHTLTSLGILQGHDDGRFAPDDSITRAEFVAMAMRFTKGSLSGENSFSDVSADAWYYDYIVGSIQYGWIEGHPDGRFAPEDSITRCEVTAMVNRMLGRSADEAYIDGHANQLTQFSDVEQNHWAYYDIMEAANAHDYERQEGAETWTVLS